MDEQVKKAIQRHQRKLWREAKKAKRKISLGKVIRGGDFMLTSFDKAIVAVLTPLIIAILVHFGLNLDANFTTALTAVLTGLVVYVVPNK